MEEKIDKSLLQQASVIKLDTYERPLTTEEKETLAESISGIVMTEELLAEEKKEAMADFKERAKLLATNRKRYTKQKRTGRVEEAGNLYTFFKSVEGKGGMAYMYNDKGQLVHERRMYALELEEHQHLLTEQEGVLKLNAANTGTNG